MLQDIEIDCGDSCERHIDGVQIPRSFQLKFITVAVRSGILPK